MSDAYQFWAPTLPGDPILDSCVAEAGDSHYHQACRIPHDSRRSTLQSAPDLLGCEG
jgi:hypothetical protein